MPATRYLFVLYGSPAERQSDGKSVHRLIQLFFSSFELKKNRSYQIVQVYKKMKLQPRICNEYFEVFLLEFMLSGKFSLLMSNKEPRRKAGRRKIKISL